MTAGTLWMVAGASWMVSAYWQHRAKRPSMVHIAIGAMNIIIGISILVGKHGV